MITVFEIVHASLQRCFVDPGKVGSDLLPPKQGTERVRSFVSYPQARGVWVLFTLLLGVD